MKNLRTGMLISSLLLPTSFHSYSAPTDAYQAPLVTESLLLDIVAAGDDKLFAVGERGHVLVSVDGNEWRQQEVPSDSTLTSVYFRGEKGWAVGHDAQILKTLNGGELWTVQQFQPEQEKPLLDVIFFDDDHGIAIGAYGIFYRSEDSGQTWQKELHPEFLSEDDQAYLEEIRAEDESFYQEELVSILPHLNRVRQLGERLYIAGESGLIAYSDDNGRKWQRMDINYFGSFFDITAASDGTIYAGGLRGNLFKKSADSERWLRVNTESTASINTLLPIENGGLLAVGNNGSLVRVNSDGACEATASEEANVQNVTPTAIGEVCELQTTDSKAITAVVLFNDRLVATSESGIQLLPRD